MSEAAKTSARGSQEHGAQLEEFPNLVNGEKLRGVAKPFDNTNPADTSDIVGRFQASSAAESASDVPPIAPSGRASSGISAMCSCRCSSAPRPIPLSGAGAIPCAVDSCRSSGMNSLRCRVGASRAPALAPTRHRDVTFEFNNAARGRPNDRDAGSRARPSGGEAVKP